MEKELKIKKWFKITDEIVQKVLWEYHHGYTANRSKNRHFENQRDLFWTNNDKEKLKELAIRHEMTSSALLSKWIKEKYAAEMKGGEE